MTDGGVLVLTGLPCAGKSSVGKLIAADLPKGRSTYIEVDALFSLLLPESNRNREDRMVAYDGAHAIARIVLGSGSTATWSAPTPDASTVPACSRLWPTFPPLPCGSSSSWLLLTSRPAFPTTAPGNRPRRAHRARARGNLPLLRSAPEPDVLNIHAPGHSSPHHGMAAGSARLNPTRRMGRSR